MALWPIIIGNKSLKSTGLPPQVIYHEQIHHQQQMELFILPFYCWYILEWLWKWVKYRDRKQAYRELSFEREAYTFENDATYLLRRRRYSFLQYL